jgi:hypothetical protein
MYCSISCVLKGGGRAWQNWTSLLSKQLSTEALPFPYVEMAWPYSINADGISRKLNETSEKAKMSWKQVCCCQWDSPVKHITCWVATLSWPVHIISDYIGNYMEKCGSTAEFPFMFFHAAVNYSHPKLAISLLNLLHLKFPSVWCSYPLFTKITAKCEFTA